MVARECVMRLVALTENSFDLINSNQFLTLFYLLFPVDIYARLLWFCVQKPRNKRDFFEKPLLWRNQPH